MRRSLRERPPVLIRPEHSLSSPLARSRAAGGDMSVSPPRYRRRSVLPNCFSSATTSSRSSCIWNARPRWRPNAAQGGDLPCRSARRSSPRARRQGDQARRLLLDHPEVVAHRHVIPLLELHVERLAFAHLQQPARERGVSPAGSAGCDVEEVSYARPSSTSPTSRAVFRSQRSARGRPRACRGVVHDVVMHEREVVHELQRCACIESSRGRPAHGFAGKQHEHGADALPAPGQDVAASVGRVPRDRQRLRSAASPRRPPGAGVVMSRRSNGCR